jgi:aminoglycoside phosphotransferase (APT) family kinase protein
METRSTLGSGGSTLLHLDLRADNILLTPDRVLAVDWPWASVGAPWIDLLLMLPSVSMQGGPPPWEIFDAHPLAQGADPAAVTRVLAGLSGFFLYASTLPPSPGLDPVRPFQLVQGQHALGWLRRRNLVS